MRIWTLLLWQGGAWQVELRGLMRACLLCLHVTLCDSLTVSSSLLLL